MQIESEYLVADLISWNSITVEKEKRRRPMISEIHYEIRLKLTLSKYIYIGAGNGNPVFLPGESCGRRSLVDCCPWGCIDSDMTKTMRTVYVESPFQKKTLKHLSKSVPFQNIYQACNLCWEQIYDYLM